jgi:hypothetical protein
VRIDAPERGDPVSNYATNALSDLVEAEVLKLDTQIDAKPVGELSLKGFHHPVSAHKAVSVAAL